MMGMLASLWTGGKRMHFLLSAVGIWSSRVWMACLMRLKYTILLFLSHKSGICLGATI